MKIKAFTLMELLVVVGITAILAAILFPVFARAREQARRAQCINNMHQLGTAIQVYLNDWGDKFPWAERNFLVDAKHPGIVQAMSGYVTDEAVWRCPSDVGEIYPADKANGFHRRTPPIFTEYADTSYQYPGLEWGTPGQLAGLLVTKVAMPALAPLMWETRPWHSPYDFAATYNLDTPGAYNLLYCDGRIAQRTLHQWRYEQSEAFPPPPVPPGRRG